jgi:hypothetical protein
MTSRYRILVAAAAAALGVATGARAQDSAATPVPRVAVPPPVPPPWRFQFDLGFQDQKGNSDITVGNTVFTIERRPRDKLILNLKLEARYGRSNGKEAVNYQLARIRFDWNPRNVISPFVGVDIARDPVRKSELRMQGGTGININVDIRDDHRTYLSLGVVGDHQVFTPDITPATSDDFRWMLRAATQQQLGQATRLEGVAKVQPAFHEPHDYLASVEASVRVALSRKLGMTTKFEWRRDSRPPLGVQRDDRSLSAGLSLAWGR